MNRIRGRAFAPIAAVVLVASLLAPSAAFAADADPVLTATLDGRPIPLADVGKYDCDDFSYPEIRCWSTRVLADSRALLVTLLTSIDYVTIYDGTSYTGASMNVSQDYATLSTIGWSDRISSMKGRNAETGTFWTDWFYGGTWYAFCCNTQVSNLGAFSNTFSSIQRT
jgi:hypothetical protein